MKQLQLKLSLIFATFAILLINGITDVVDGDRQGTGRRIEQDDSGKVFKSSCGTSEEVAHKIGQCLEPILALVEGRFKAVKDDQGLQETCDRFSTTEKCVRNISKDCLGGIHKATVSAIASSTKRFRNTQCKTPELRDKFMKPLQCTLKKGNEIQALDRNITGIIQGVRDLSGVSAEEKLLKNCCVLNRLDKETETIFNRECPESTSVIIGIVHAVTDDARNALCRNPKCQGALDGVLRSKYKPPQNLLEPIMQVLFLLN